MNWNDLRYFLEVAREGRLLSAAGRLGVNHTTVARRIKSLETDLAVTLFEQDKTGFHLTASGEILLPLAQQMDDVSDIVRERMHLRSKSHTGKLRIGAPDGFGNSFLAPNITDFLTSHPELTLELVPVPYVPNLTKREVDLVISLEPAKAKDLWCRKITDYVLFVYGSKDFIKKNEIETSDVKALEKTLFSGYIPDLLYTEELSFNKHISPKINSRFQSSTVMAQQHFIASGGGLGVLPHFMAHQDPRLVCLWPERYQFIRSYWLLIPYEVRRLASVRGLENAIVEMVGENRELFLPRS